ncbi:hypothetical protein C8J57DRAFT_1541635 [Mycena rebaudengoi]|nr:hypothetical protein C8J57DRAFT_1541635 [Mycena rebaudengoi]
MAARSLYSLLCANLSLSDDPTYTRFRPSYVTDQPKYADVPQRQRSALHPRAQRNFPEPSSEHLPTCRQLVLPVPRTALRTTLRTAPNLPCAPAHRPTTRITGSADRPAHLRPTSLRTCAAQLPAL